MTSDDTMAIERIRRLCADYCLRFDEGDLDGWVSLFTSDAVFAVGRNEYVGRDDIRAWAATATTGSPQPTQHRIANLAVDFDDASTARVTSDFIVVGADLRISAAGRYADRVVARDGSWLIAERRITFLRPAS